MKKYDYSAKAYERTKLEILQAIRASEATIKLFNELGLIGEEHPEEDLAKIVGVGAEGFEAYYIGLRRFPPFVASRNLVARAVRLGVGYFTASGSGLRLTLPDFGKNEPFVNLVCAEVDDYGRKVWRYDIDEGKLKRYFEDHKTK